MNINKIETKSDYKEKLKELADTTLYELTIKNTIVMERSTLENALRDPSYWKNSEIYQEFWRRNKHEKYYDAYNTALEIIGKPKNRVKSPARF